MQLKHLLLTALIVLSLCIAQNAEAKEIYMQVKVYYDTKYELVDLKHQHLDIIDATDTYFEIITHPGELENLQAMGFRTEVMHEDLVSLYQSRLVPDKLMGGYLTLSEINAYIDSLVADHPDIVSQKYNLGQTIEGRDMWAVKISDNPNLDEDEPEVLFTAAIHAREVITPLIIRNFAEYMTTNYGLGNPEVQNLVNNREIWLIFCCNPDGYYYNEYTDPNGGGMWRKNRRNNMDGYYGVDLNRNFGYQWGYDNDGSSPYTPDPTYRGPSAFSEPESQNLRDFHLAHDFIISVYFHSHSDLVLWPWGYDELYTDEEDLFSLIGDSAATFNGYTAGVVWDAINYTANGSTDDWIYYEQIMKNKTYAFTFEVGDAFWPAPSEITEMCDENLGAMLFLSDLSGSIFGLLPPESPAVSVADSVEAMAPYTVSWTHDDTLNPAVEFELMEMSEHVRLADNANNFDNFTNNDFSISSARSYSSPSSFFSGAVNSASRYVEYVSQFAIEEGDSLKFMTWYDIEDNWDYAYVQVSAGGSAFETVPGNITTNYDPYGANWGNGITGSSGGWIEAKFDLSAYVGQSIILRLTYKTDSYTLEEGIYIDDIYPIDMFSNQTGFSHTGSEYSHIFNDKTEGEYYYKVRAKDDDGQWSVFSPLSSTTVFVPEIYLCGDANSDDDVNLSDAVYIISYIFVSGESAPIPYLSGDTNCDTMVNVSDAVWIVNYVFAGGKTPCDVDGDDILDCSLFD